MANVKKHPLAAFYSLYGQPTTGGKEGSPLMTMDTYGGGVRSRAKRDMIKKIAAELSEKLKLAELNPKNKTVDQIVEQLRKVIPDPRAGKGNGKTWSAASAGVACRKIGEILNESYGIEIVDPKASEHEICEQVSEAMGSLVSDLTEEVSGTRSEISRILKNMETVLHFLDRVYNAIVSRIAEDRDSNLAGQTTAMRSIYDEVKKELERQMLLLRNMIGTLDPSGEKLDLLTQHAGEFKHLIRRIKDMPGSTEFGKKVALALSSMGTVMEVAKIVDDALNTVGLSVAEYKKLKDPREIVSRFAELVRTKLSETVDSGDIYKFLKAILTIYKHHYLHDDIVKSLQKTGGAVGGLKLDRRVKQRSRAIKEVLRFFSAKLADLFAHILEHAEAVGKDVGAGNVPLSDHLDSFARAIELIPDIRKRYVYYSLSGFRDDVNSRQEREDFLSAVRHVNEVLNEIIADERYKKNSHFIALHEGFGKLYQFIEEFSARLKEGMGLPLPKTCVPDGKKEGAGLDPEQVRKVAKMAKAISEAAIRAAPTVLDKGADVMEIAARVSRDLARGAQSLKDTMGKGEDDEEDERPEKCDFEFTDAEIEEAEETTGACDKTAGAEASSPAVARLGATLQQIKDIILYYFRTAKIRANLRNASEEMKCYSESYEKVLGDAIAGALDNLVKEKEELKKRINSTEDDELYKAILYKECNPDVDFSDGHVGGTDTSRATAEQKSNAKEKFEKIIRFKCERIDAKITMYRIAEAVDLYMCAFTDSITAQPDALQDLIRILGDVENISKWYTDKFGDAICEVFDSFPYTFNRFKPNPKVELTDDGHYYEKWINPISDDNGIPGLPILGIPISPDGDSVVDELSDKFDITALKNIMAVFVRVAGKFGDRDLFKKVPMSPAQIYRGLRTYMIQSAFDVGVDPDKDDSITVYNPGINANPGDDYTLKLITGDNISIRPGVCGHGITLAPAHAAVKPLFEQGYMTMSMAKDSKFKTGPKSDFAETDLLFVLTIKAMIAKVFTAIGTFNMFQRPINEHGLGYSSGLRTILGGVVSSPEVVPEAMELYLRLPLLAEFYRKIFNFEEGVLKDSQNFRKITMIPEVDGVFSKLINFIFDDAQKVKEGEYSDTDTRRLIEIINTIYVKFRGKQDPVNTIIREFVAEINRRYGLLNRDERRRYIKKRLSRYKSKYEPADEDIDFELAGIDEFDDFVRPSPSMSFMRGLSLAAPEHKYQLAIEDNLDDICRLNEAIAKILDTAKPGDNKDLRGRQDYVFKRVSFDQMIRSRREELSHAKTEIEKFDVVHSMISTLGQFSLPALEKSLIAFHEFVIAPLNLLKAAHSELTMFIQRIEGLYDAIETVHKYLQKDNPMLAPNDRYDVHDGTIIEDGHNLGAADPNNIFNPDNESFRKIRAYLIYGVCDDDTGRNDVLLGPNTRGGGREHNITYKTLTYLLFQNKPNERDYADGCDEKEKSVGAKLREFVEHYVLDAHRIFRMLIETLFEHTTSLEDLVRLKLDVNRRGDRTDVSIFLDHSKLIEQLEALFTGTKRVFERFRGLLPQEILEEFEKLSNERGSLYWIEKHLIDEMLHGRTENPEAKTLNSVNAMVKRVVAWLTFSSDISPNRLPSADDGTIEGKDILGDPITLMGTGTTLPKWSLSGWDWFRGLISSSDKLRPNRAVFANVAVAEYNPATHSGILSLLFNTSGRDLRGIPANQLIFPLPRGETHIALCYDRASASTGPDKIIVGLIEVFNALVAVYLQILYEGLHSKVYAKALRAFADGAFNAAVYGAQYLNDIVESRVATPGFVKEANPLSGGRLPLYKSLALIIRRLMTEPASGSTTCPQFLVENIDEVSLYTRERMKAEFPVMGKLFELIVRRCEFLRNVARMFRMSADTGANDLWDGAAGEEVENAQKINSMLDAIASGARSLVECIRDTLADLHDDPKYLETRDKFIQSYEETNHMLPFMPLSSALHFLRNDASPAKVLPRVGEDRFKLLYGTRGILHKETGIKSLPGVEDILKGHNGSVKERYRIDDKQRDQILRPFQMLLRYLVDEKHYAGRLVQIFLGIVRSTNARRRGGRWFAPGITDSNFFGRHEPIGGPTVVEVWPVPSVVAIDENYLVYSIRGTTSVSDVIRMTESAFQKVEKRSIISIVDKKLVDIVNNRDQMIAHNIIDLNIMPVNVHALMREVPLVNLLNYSFSFDKHVQELLDVHIPARKTSIVIKDITGSEYIHGRKLLAHMLTQPYLGIDERVYHYGVSRIFRGDLGIEGLARPRFMADDVFNKALFGEVYAAEMFRDGADPAVGHGKLRGAMHMDNRDALATYLEVHESEIKGKLFAALLELFGMPDELVIRVRHLRDSSTKDTGTGAPHANADAAVAHVSRRLDDLGGTLTLDLIDRIPEVGAIVAAEADDDDKNTERKTAIADIIVAAGFVVDNLYRRAIEISRSEKSGDPATRMAATRDKFRNELTPMVASWLYGIVEGRGPGGISLNIAGKAYYDTIAARFAPYRAAPPRDDGAFRFFGTADENEFLERILAEVINIIGSKIIGFHKGYMDIPFSRVLDTMRNNTEYQNQSLHYLGETDKSGKLEVKAAHVGEYKHFLQLLGWIRFDTKFIRNLFWIVNLQRILRLKMRRDLTWYNSRIVTEFSTLAPSITELYGDDVKVVDYKY